jgi:SAM-dependent methyltransferase
MDRPQPARARSLRGISDRVHFAVTTSRAPRRDDLAAARDSAGRWQVPFVERGDQALAAVASAAGVPALLVLAPDRAALWVDGHTASWDAGMGALRLKRLRSGERSTRDGFLDAAQLRAGDAVLDCSLGLGTDALVAAEAVGPAGRVVALEASAPLAALTAEGLCRLRDAAAARVAVHHADAADWLSRAAGASFDVVVFDPMFRRPRAQPPGFDLVRQLGDPRPLAPETLAQARRVARRAVLVKDGAPGWELARLGLTPLPGSRWAHRVYARMDTVVRSS